MTSDELKEYLKTEAEAAGIPTAQIDSRVNRSAQFGVSDFWNAWPWTFRVADYSHTVAAGEESSNLPANFAAIKSIRETNSTFGRKLQFLEKEEFDRIAPKPTADPVGEPWYFTVYRDLDDGRYKIQFAPRPDFTGTLPMVIYLQAPSDASEVPESGIEGIVTTCVKYIYKQGSPEQVNMARQSYLAIERLKKIDKVNLGKIHRLAPDPEDDSLKSRGELFVNSWLE